ncbi:MAG: hypothetical protein COB67_03200 [SAR324 cluster bacterium]|uniref:GGDEF domain-containing response regulator n=1 Tax=SAR324 cluster bacterium TaxID=2024889 RepID=A0A2A4T828_9DELT|nr:MAG: hypothetical protein COB67_03200 [SAR324 cluster bacterium]
MSEHEAKILVVNDEPHSLYLMTRLIELLSIEIIEVKSGEQALQRVRQHEVFLILIAVPMSESKEVEVATTLHQDPESKHIPIIFITAGNYQKQFLLEAYEAGAVDYIYEPLAAQILKSKIIIFKELWLHKLELKKERDNLQQLNEQLLNTTKALNLANENLSQIALHDTLTGLANRKYFLSSLEMAFSRAQREGSHLGLLFLDLDNFKGVNDTFGHDAGDELLRTIAKRLRASVRTQDLVCRLGGDEFAILAEGLKEELQADRIAQAILEQIAIPVDLKAQKLHVTTSIGIATYPKCATDMEELMQCADIAMYRAKKDGRNNYRFYTNKLQNLAGEYTILKNEMKEALDQGDFEIYYQPQIKSLTGEVVGLEALLRWNHPNRGILAASEFISVAEHTGLMRPIGEWALSSVCQHYNSWAKEGLINGNDLTICVNISSSQLQERRIVETIFRIMESSALSNGQLKLEIDENTVVDDMELCMDVLKKMSDRGVVIAIDGFGSGYASFRHIKRLPVQYLKIDPSFIKDIPQDKTSTEIVKAMIGMGKALGIKVVASGVERNEQVKTLTAIGCDLLQGYYFYEPLRAEQVTALLKKQGDEK